MVRRTAHATAPRAVLAFGHLAQGMYDTATRLTPFEVHASLVGRVAPAPVTGLYRMGMAVVALAMIVLPLLYLALVAAAAVLIGWHLTANGWLVSGRHSFWRLLAYVGPALAGLILLFFLIKPLFARASRRSEPLALTAEDEPVLFAFIDRICDLVRAPRPARVVVDCQVNASASFENGLAGLLRRRLVLTIGLPLVEGLTARQLSGVLAHEFGHFTQGAGMGVTYVIRSISQWFGRVVYERDEWDERLERWTRNADWRIAAVLWLARGGVWLSRWVLYALMLAGNAISSFMLRQMEFDADYYETCVAGSRTFAVTSHRLRELGASAEESYRDLQHSWQSRRLPANLAALIVQRTTLLPAEVRHAIKDGLEVGKTGLFDTHPADAERIRRAAALDAAGLARLEGPSSGLFTGFDALARRVTEHHYGADLGLNLHGVQFVEATALLHEAHVARGAGEALRVYFADVLLGSRPFTLDGAVPADSTVEGLDPGARLAAMRERVGLAASGAREAARRFAAAEERWETAMGAVALFDAGMKRIEAAEFGLTRSTREEAVRVRDAALKEQQASTTELDQFEAWQRARLRLALELAGSRGETQDAAALPGVRAEIARLEQALGVLLAAWPTFVNLRHQFLAWRLLLINQQYSADAARTLEHIDGYARRLRGDLDALSSALEATPYPFAHAREAASLATYLRADSVTHEDHSALYEAVEGHIDRALTLYYQMLGRLAAIVLQVENDLLPAEAATTTAIADAVGLHSLDA